MVADRVHSSFMIKVCRLIAFIVGIGINFDHFSIMGVSVVSLIIILYFIFIILTFGGSKIRTNERMFYWPPIAYLLLLVFLNIINSNDVSDSVFPVSFIFCLVLYYISIIHVKKDPNSIMSFLFGISVGGVLLTLFFNLGIGVEYESGRLFLFGSNPNNLGCLMCLSAAIILDVWIIKDYFKLKFLRYSFAVLLIPIIQVIFATASRTAFLALAIVIILAFSITPTKRIITKVFYIFVLVAIIYFVYQSLADYETLYLRVVEMGETEDYTSGREGRWQMLFNVALQNPLGMGQTGFAKIAKSIMSSSDIDGMASPHNVFLEVLLYTGFAGFIIMSYFWFHVIKKTWLFYKGNKDLLLVLLMSVLLVQMLLGQILIFRTAWIVFGIIAGINLQEVCSRNRLNKTYGK